LKFHDSRSDFRGKHSEETVKLALHLSWTISYARACVNEKKQTLCKHCADTAQLTSVLPAFPLPILFIITWNERERYLRKIWVDRPSGIEGSPVVGSTPFFPHGVTFSLMLLADKDARFLTRRFKNVRAMSNLAD